MRDRAYRDTRSHEFPRASKSNQPTQGRVRAAGFGWQKAGAGKLRSDEMPLQRKRSSGASSSELVTLRLPSGAWKV